MMSRGPCIAIPTKNRHHSLRQTLASACACGVPVYVCDQSEQAFQATAAQDVTVLHRPDIISLPAARNALLGLRRRRPDYFHRRR